MLCYVVCVWYYVHSFFSRAGNVFLRTVTRCLLHWLLVQVPNFVQPCYSALCLICNIIIIIIIIITRVKKLVIECSFECRSWMSLWRQTWSSRAPRSFWTLWRTTARRRDHCRRDCSRWIWCMLHRWVTLQVFLLIGAPQVGKHYRCFYWLMLHRWANTTGVFTDWCSTGE